MKLVYPHEGYETCEISTFLLGCVAPGAQLQIQGQTAPVSEEGYFSRMLPLQPGDNTVVLTETDADGTVRETREVLIRRTPAAVLTDIAAQKDTLRHYCFPTEDVGIRPGESIYLYCFAPADATITFQIESISNRDLDLTPIPLPLPDNREGCFGQLHQLMPPWPEGVLYSAHIRVPDDAPPLPNLWVRYTMTQGEQSLTLEANGTLTVLPRGKKQYGVVTAPQAVVRTLPIKGARLTPLLKGTTVEITGFDDSAFRIDYGPQQSAWVDSSQMMMTEHLIYPPLVPLHLVQVRNGLRSVQLALPLPRLVPYQFQLRPNQIILDLHQTVSRCDFIHYEPGTLQQGLTQVEVQPLDHDTTRIVVTLHSPLMGMQPVFDHDRNILVLNIRTQASLQHTPFVVALDPGHGGNEIGARALDGTAEKDLNMAIALKVQDALATRSDIEVMLTRQGDEEVSLEERVARAVAAEANLLLSIHHNALPDGRNPMEERGVSSYYYHPFALPIARQLQEALVAQTELPDYGILFDSLHMCRVMEMPAILLELGFLIHPDDLRLCLDPHHQNRVAQSIGQVIESLNPYVKHSV